MSACKIRFVKIVNIKPVLCWSFSDLVFGGNTDIPVIIYSVITFEQFLKHGGSSYGVI